MRGVLFAGDRRVAIATFPDPEPGPGEVVVAMKVAAVCGSDLHGYRMPAATRRERGLAGTIPGHEPCGEVVAIGAGVGRVRVGDRVAVYHYRGCGHCHHCQGGDLMWCAETRGYGGPIHGADADLLLTDERNCLPLPAHWGYERGVFTTCIGATAYQSVTKLGVSGAGDLVIWGLGPVGLIGALMARALGARVIGVDPVAERRQLAEEFGAALTIDPTAGDATAAIRAATGGEGARWGFETSGSKAAQAASVDAAARGGHIVYVGHGNGEPSILPGRFIGKQLRLEGSFVAPLHAYGPMVAFIDRHDLRPERLITHRLGLDAAAEAFALADRAGTGKVVFTWE